MLQAGRAESALALFGGHSASTKYRFLGLTAPGSSPQFLLHSDLYLVGQPPGHDFQVDEFPQRLAPLR